jgi:hypothetical protein
MPVAVVVDAVVTMLEKADPGPIVGMLAPGAILWHNNDGVEMDAAQGFERIGGLHALVGGLHIEVTHADEIDDGVVIRFVIGGVVKASGAPLAVRNCLFVLLDGGRITRVEEYLDPTFGSQLGVSA